MLITLFPYIQIFSLALCFETDVIYGIQKKTAAIHRICGNIIVLCVVILRSWLSVVAVVNTLWAGQQWNHGVIPGLDKRFFSSVVSRLHLGDSHPPIRWVLGVKWSVCKAYHSPPSLVEVKNKWRYTSSAPYTFIVCIICPYPQC